MEILAFDSSMIQAILPEILLLVLAGAILTVDLIWRSRRPFPLGWITAGGLIAILVVSLVFSRPEPTERLIFGGMLRHDWPAFSFRLIFLFAAAITSLLSTDLRGLVGRGEYYALLVVTTLGMSLMAAASDLIMLTWRSRPHPFRFTSSPVSLNGMTSQPNRDSNTSCLARLPLV